MEKNKQISAIAETEEERLLLVRVLDRLERARQRQMPGVTAFLSPREQALLRQILPNCRFFGGMEQADRKMAFFLPDYLSQEEFFDNGPIACLRAGFYEENGLSHRDMLGAIMGTGIRRDAVGDICLQEKSCDFFVLSELAEYLLNNLNSAGRQHLHLERIPLSRAERKPQRMKEFHTTVSSLRLDSVLAAGFHLSRSSAAEAIRGGMAALDSLTCMKPDRPVGEGSEISLRGKGKFRILSVDGITRKGRQGLSLGIYL